MAQPAPIGPDLARSWLLVNGLKPDEYTATGEADITILDIEDGVAPADKAEARDRVAEYLSDASHRAWVRINGFGTTWWQDDCRALAGKPGLEGVMLPMVDTPEHVIRTQQMIRYTKIAVQIETARGLQAAGDIATCRPTFALCFGSGDFRLDTGIADDPMALAYVRSQLTVAARAAGLRGVIDGPTVGASGDALRDATATSARFGMTGKLCLNAGQTATVNEALSPSETDIVWACDLLKHFHDRNGIIRSGSELPRLARANKLIALARSFGKPAPEGYDDFPEPSFAAMA